MRLFAWILITACFINAQSLDELLKLVDTENNHLKSYSLSKEAFEFEGEASSYLMNPKLSTNYYPAAVITANGAQRLTLSAVQAFPWFGTLDAKKNVYSKKADVIDGQFQLSRDQLQFKVKSAYYMLAGFQKKKVIFESYKQQLALYLQSSLSKYTAGKGSQLDVIHIQTEVSFIDQKLMALDDEIEMQLHMINHVVDRIYEHIPATFPKIITNEVMMNQKIRNNEIAIVDLQKNILKAEISVEEKKALPTMALGIMYHEIEKSDAFGIQFSIDIPLWTGANDKRIESLNRQSQALTYQQEDLETKLHHDLMRFKSRKKIIKKRIDHLLGTLKPQAELAFTTGLISYENGETELLSVLNSKRLLNELEINLTQLESSFWINDSQIDLLNSGSEQE